MICLKMKIFVHVLNAVGFMNLFFKIFEDLNEFPPHDLIFWSDSLNFRFFQMIISA